MNNKIEKVLDVTRIFDIFNDAEIPVESTNPEDANLTELSSEFGLLWKFLSADFRKENNIN